MPKRLGTRSARRDGGNGSDFRTYRLRAKLSIKEASQWLGVSARTIQEWESPRGVRIPYSAFRLMRVRCGYELPHPDWFGWAFVDGELWGPAMGRGFTAAELEQHELYCRMADAWRRDYDKRAAEARLNAAKWGESALASHSGDLNEIARNRCVDVLKGRNLLGDHRLPIEGGQVRKEGGLQIMRQTGALGSDRSVVCPSSSNEGGSNTTAATWVYLAEDDLAWLVDALFALIAERSGYEPHVAGEVDGLLIRIKAAADYVCQCDGRKAANG